MPDASKSLGIRPVQDRKDLDLFIRLPWKIQADDPCWVPPLIREQRRFLDSRTGPFFEHGEAVFLLAFRNGKVVGRLSAHVNHAWERCQDPSAGFFGFFECLEDREAAHALFDAGAAWLKNRGKTKVLGPMSFGIYDEIGLLTDGYDILPPMLLTHNPPFYPALWESWGFSKSVDWLALRTRNRDVDPEAMKQEAVLILKGTSRVMRAPSPWEVMRRSGEVFDLFNSAWQANWGHVPFTRRQFENILHELRPALRSDLIRIVEEQGKILAFMITIADLNPQIQKLNGRCTWLDRLRLLGYARWRPLQKVKTVLLGVERRMQRRRLHDAMILDTYADLICSQPELQVGDCSLIVEAHRHFLRGLERYGVERYKTYRIYERAL